MLDPIFITLIALICGWIVFMKIKTHKKNKSADKIKQAKEKNLEMKYEKKEINNYESNLVLGINSQNNESKMNFDNRSFKKDSTTKDTNAQNSDITIDDKLRKLKEEMEQDFDKKLINIKQEYDLDRLIDDKRINILERKSNIFLNSYKVLYLRKIANIILDTILNSHCLELYKTENMFRDETKPIYKKRLFPIIIAKKDINSIGMNTINLLIDYLMFAKDFSSSVIHIVEKSQSQIEILFDLFGREKIKTNNEVYTVSISLLINTFFSKNSKVNSKLENSDNLVIIEEKKKEDNADIVNSEVNKLITQNSNIINDIKEKQGSVLSSENGHSTDDEKTKSLQMFSNNINLKSSNEINICTISEEDNEKARVLEKNILFKKIDEIIENLKEYYINKKNNILINDVIAQINSLNVDNLLKQENEFSENEILKLQKIKELNKLILSNNNLLDENAVIDGEFIFQKWKTTFHKNYKATEEFQDLVLYDENVKFGDLENAVKALISEQEINIFCEDPGDFKSYKMDTIAKSQFKNYNLDFKAKKKASK